MPVIVPTGSRFLWRSAPTALDGYFHDLPHRAITLVEHGCRLAVELVDDAAGLGGALELSPAEELAVQSGLVELASSVAAEQILREPGVTQMPHGEAIPTMVLLKFRSVSVKLSKAGTRGFLE